MRKTMLDEVIEHMKKKYPIIGMLRDIKGPFVNPLNGREYFEGIYDDGSSKIKFFFDVKFVEYGKVRVVEEKK